MDRYNFALFLHVVTLIAAAVATTVTKLAVGRRSSARTVGEMLDWHKVLMSASGIFPICLAGFTITGMYMLNVAHMAWKSGFVIAGLTGIVLLLVSGIYLGVKAKGYRQFLEGLAKNGADQPAPRVSPPILVRMLPVINTGIALAVVFDMVMKPASIVTALGIIGLGIVVTGAMTLRKSPARQASTALSEG